MTLQRFCKKIIKGEKLEVGYKAPGSIFTLEQENLLNHYVVHAPVILQLNGVKLTSVSERRKIKKTKIFK